MISVVGAALAAVLATQSPGSPQSPQPQPSSPRDGLFQVDRSVDPMRVTADRVGVSADHALLQLAEAVGWSIRFETPRLQNELSLHSFDLSFDDQGPRTIAHLIAVGAGADVTFEERRGQNGVATTMHVISTPDPTTESGRLRMRQWSTQWYQTFLADALQLDPLVVQKGMDARMHLGELLLSQGDLEGARAVFQSVYDRDPVHPFVPRALLKLTRCLMDLKRLDEAETWARELSRKNPNLPETAEASVLLGRILIAAGKYDQAVAFLDASLVQLAGTPETIDVLLLIGEAHRLRGRLDRTYERMTHFAESLTFREIGHRQWLDYHFLRGAAAEAVGKHAEAMEALEVMLGTGPADPRRGVAFVMLGRCYLSLGRYLEAVSAVVEAKTYDSQLDPQWRKELRILDAKSALAVGDEQRAFDELETELRRGAALPDLTLFLVDAYIDIGRLQRAIEAANLLVTRDDAFADRGRHRIVQAMYLQAEKLGIMAGFPAQAIPLATAIADEELQRRCAELIGRAYESVGDRERAADAFRGFLR